MGETDRKKYFKPRSISFRREKLLIYRPPYSIEFFCFSFFLFLFLYHYSESRDKCFMIVSKQSTFIRRSRFFLPSQRFSIDPRGDPRRRRRRRKLLRSDERRRGQKRNVKKNRKQWKREKEKMKEEDGYNKVGRTIKVNNKTAGVPVAAHARNIKVHKQLRVINCAIKLKFSRIRSRL